jgi:hypothetical protein
LKKNRKGRSQGKIRKSNWEGFGIEDIFGLGVFGGMKGVFWEKWLFLGILGD